MKSKISSHNEIIGSVCRLGVVFGSALTHVGHGLRLQQRESLSDLLGFKSLISGCMNVAEMIFDSEQVALIKFGQFDIRWPSWQTETN